MAEPTISPAPNKRPWALTIFGLIAAGGLIAMPFLAGPPNGEKLPDMVRFIGRFHPVLLHLPIGVFSLILIQELGAIFFRKKGEKRETTVFPMFFGAASAIVAVIAGFLLYQGDKDGAYSGALAERHLWGGLAFAVAAVITFIVKAWTVATAGNSAFFRLLLFGSVGIMGFASHDGASITHGSDYLTQYAPDPIRKMIGLRVNERTTREAGTAETVAKDPIVYADIVAPILERRCVQCHKEGNTKGRLRMDTYELLLKGGKEGPAIEPGSAEKSNSIVRIELPLDEDEHMPPEGKPQLEAHEISVLKWWLDSGADPAKKLSEIPVPDAVKEALAKLGPVSAAKSGGVDEKKSAAAGDDLKAKVAELSKEFPSAVNFESLDSPLVTFNAVSRRGDFDDATFAKLSPILPHLVTLELQSTKITDASIAKLSVAENLKRLRLQETVVTDASIDTLVKLKNLESINLFGTKVTDKGVIKLAELPNLKSLYLWQTAVTPETIATLKAKLPNCNIVTGI